MNTWKDGKSKKNGNAEIESHGFPSWEHSAWSSRLLTWVALEASCSSSLCQLVSIDSISCFVHFLENMWGSQSLPTRTWSVSTGYLWFQTNRLQRAVCPRSQHLGSYLLDPPNYLASPSKTTRRGKTEKTSATLNCVRGSDRYHCPEGCSWNKLNI